MVKICAFFAHRENLHLFLIKVRKLMTINNNSHLEGTLDFLVFTVVIHFIFAQSTTFSDIT